MKRSQFLKLIFVWSGPVLILMGIGAGLITNNWGILPLTFLLLGLFIMTFQVLLLVTQRSFWQQRSTQVGTNATIATLAVVILLILVNLFASRHPLRLDLTENQQYTLAPQSQQVVKQLKTPVKIVIFDSTQPETAVNTLENYRRLSGGQLTYEFIDPRTRPGLAEEFGVQQLGEVYLETGDQKQLLQTLQDTPLSESRLTNALARLSRDQEDMVYFLQGHGEYNLEQISQATDRLQERNYVSLPLNLAERINQGEDPIPEDARVVVVANPQRSLLPPEVQALGTYLDQGGGLFLLIDPYTDPGLDPLLKTWGVTLDDRLVIDGAGGVVGIDPATGGLVGYGPIAPLITRYGSHPITADFGNGNSFYPLARAVLTENVPGIESTPLFLTNSQSWAESDTEEERPGFDQEKDLPGPLDLGVALTRPQTSPENLDNPNPSEAQTNTKPEPRLVVIGSSRFFTNGLFDQQLNGDVFTNAVVWLSQRQGEILSISPKEATNRRIELAAGQRNLVYWLALVILPLFGCILALLIWLQRR